MTWYIPEPYHIRVPDNHQQCIPGPASIDCYLSRSRGRPKVPIQACPTVFHRALTIQPAGQRSQKRRFGFPLVIGQTSVWDVINSIQYTLLSMYTGHRESMPNTLVEPNSDSTSRLLNKI